MSIVVTCSCGQGFTAKDALAGRHVQCPKCGGVIFVPKAEALQQLPDEPLAAPVPQQPLGPAAGSVPYQWGPQPQQKQGGNVGLIVGLSVGGGLLLLVGIIVVVTIVAVSGRKTEVAQQPKASPFIQHDTTNTAPPSVPRAEPIPYPRPLPDSDPAADYGTTHGGSVVNQSVTPPQNPNGTETSTDTSTPATPPKTLDWAATAWYADPTSNLRGMRQVRDTRLEFYQYSWMCELLPHLGHERLYNQINFDQRWFEVTNVEVAQAVIPEFLNPADDRRVWEEPTHRGAALTHFVGMSGVEDGRNVVAARLPRSDPRAGIFGYDRVASLAEITDGTSQTIMIIGSGEIAGPWIGGGGFTVRGARQPYFTGDNQPIGFGTKGLSQRGAVVLMADGSVRHLSADMDPNAFRSLCTIHGEDSVDQHHLGRQVLAFPTK